MTVVSPLPTPWWLPGGHLQTIWRKLDSVPRLSRSRQRIVLPDSDFIDVDHLPALPQELSAESDATKPWILLVHGLGGCSASPYILSMQSVLQQQGYHSVAMNLRGCSGDFNRLPETYHSGRSDDVESVVDVLAASGFKGRPLIVIGYSLGANVLIKWASETQHQGKLRAVVSVSNPFSLDVCSARMNSGLPYWYGRHFLQILRSATESKKQLFEQTGQCDHLQRLQALGDLGNLRTLWDFDEAVTAPLHGFLSAQDYYQRCSSRQFIGQIKQPVLIVHGVNDPIIPPQALPLRDELPDNVQLDLRAAGGHVGFTARQRKDWLEHRILQFIELT